MDEKKTRGDLPLTDAEAKAAGVPLPFKPSGPGVELLIDQNFVNIPLSRYSELVQEEAIMDALVSFYVTKGTGYAMNNLMEALFGPRKESADA